MSPTIELNRIIFNAVCKMYDEYGADPDKTVLSSQEVHTILLGIEFEFLKALK